MAAALPKAFRQALKLGLETTRRGLETLMAANETAWKVEEGLPSSQSAIAALVQEMGKFTQGNVEANIRLAERLVDAESAEQAFDLCSQYMQERMTSLMGQWQSIGALGARPAETPDAEKAAAPIEPTAPKSRNAAHALVSSVGEHATQTTNGSGAQAPSNKRNPARPSRTIAATPPSKAADHRHTARPIAAQAARHREARTNQNRS